jgi:hypothetical protein
MSALLQPVRGQLEKIPGGFFGADDHVYYDESMLRVPGTTSLLETAGMVCYAGISEAILNRKAQIGTAAHAASHFFDEGDLNESTVDPAVLGYVDAWKLFRRESDFEPEFIEYRGISEVEGMHYGWTLDRTGLLSKRRSLLELKCTANVEPSWGPQTSAYEMASRRLGQNAGPFRRRLAVWLKPNGIYRLISYSDVQDYQIFKLALRCHYMPSHRDAMLKTIRLWMEARGKTFGMEAEDDGNAI